MLQRNIARYVRNAAEGPGRRFSRRRVGKTVRAERVHKRYPGGEAPRRRYGPF